MIEKISMSVEKITIDTNILIYSLDRNHGEKHKLAIKVIEKAIKSNCILTLQVLCEFYAVTTRKNSLPQKIAQEQILDWQALFPVVIAKTESLARAINATSSHKLAFWDAMLWATARDAGVTILLSEDFQSNRLIEKVRVVNPFITNHYWSV